MQKETAGRTTPLEVSSGRKKRRRQPTLKTPSRAEWREGLTGETVAVACMVAKWAFLMSFSGKIVFFQNFFTSKNAIKCQIMLFWHFFALSEIFMAFSRPE